MIFPLVSNYCQVMQCNLKEMKCTKSVVIFFVIDDMVTQEEIQKLLFLFYFIFFFFVGGINCQSSQTSC